MWVKRKIQKLLVRAHAGDSAARATAETLMKTHGWTEADIPPMRGRGRPRESNRLRQEGLWEDDGLRRLNVLAQDVTQRTKENYTYFVVGYGTLESNPNRWAWLLRHDIETGRRFLSQTVISQLGRVDDEGARKIFADRLCELRPRVKEAIPLLRAWDARRSASLLFLMQGDSAAVIDEISLESAARGAMRAEDYARAKNNRR